VRDSEGFTDETKLMVNVQRTSEKPLVWFFVEPTTGDEGTPFKFDVEVFSQIHTASHLLELRWDWDHDGTWDTDWSTNRVFYHTFESEGSKEVWLEVRDLNDATRLEKGYYMGDSEDDELRDEEIGRIVVKKITAPRANFSTWPVEVTTGTIIHFDASISLRAVDYRFDFNADGTFDTEWFKANEFQYTYEYPGQYNAILEVRNNLGETDRTQRTIFVTEEGNIPPEAKFNIRNMTNPTAGATKGVLLDEFTLNAGSSLDRDAGAAGLQVRWDYEGDGNYDTTFSKIKSAKHRYTQTGVFHPTVEVVDEKGGHATAQVRIEIVENTPPIASLKVAPLLGTPETDFRFDATDSYDDQSEKAKLSYRFDFEGDGQFDTIFASANSLRHKFTELGKKTALVEVRDYQGAVSQATFSYEVISPKMPIAAFTVEPETGTYNTTFKFDSSLSYDPSYADEKLKYRWDFDYHGISDISFDTGWQTNSKITHRFASIGEHVVRLTVKNFEENQTEFFKSIKINPFSAYTDYLLKKNIISEEHPDQLLTRAELARIVVKATGIKTLRSSEQLYTDIPARSTYAPYIQTVVERGWMSLRGNFAFEPEATVNRAELVKIIISALLPRVAPAKQATKFRDVLFNSWYYRYANAAYDEGLIDVTNNRFHPSKLVTQGEAARLVVGLLQKYGQRAVGNQPATTTTSNEPARIYLSH
jgi:PKD repeat protein